jgi:hypothetical protein
MPLYVYGLMRAEDLEREFDLGHSANAPRVQTVAHEGLVALVGVVEGDPVRLRREALVAHNDVLQRALEYGAVLPLRFGTVITDSDVLKRDFLAARHGELRARLEGLAGKAEFRLKVSYREEPVLRELIAGDPELRRSAELVRGIPAEASHFQRVGLGERISAAVQARRERDAQELMAQLGTLAEGVEVDALHHPAMVLNASFLVAEEMRERFDATVERLAADRAQRMEFKLIGPLPAHSFADRAPAAAPAPPAGPPR